jgi:hypothetical protein
MNDNRPMVKKLVDTLKTLPYGTKLSHSELTSMAGKSTVENRNIVSCSNRMLKRHHERCLRNIHGFGYTVEQWTSEPKAKDSGFLITEVTSMDGAILLAYRPLGNSPEDSTLRRNMPIDTSTVRFLLSRVGDISS